MLQQFSLKLHGNLCEAQNLILLQMEQIQLGRRCAQKAFGKIRFGTSKPGKNRFPDIDDNTVVQGGTDKDGSVERVGPGQDQIPRSSFLLLLSV